MNCTKCVYVAKEQHRDEQGKPVIGEHLYRCTRFPPQTLTIPTPQGMNLATVFPLVGLHMLCGEFEEGQGLASVN